MQGRKERGEEEICGEGEQKTGGRAK